MKCYSFFVSIFFYSVSYLYSPSLSRSGGVLNVKKYLNLTEANNKKRREWERKKNPRKEKR